MKRLCRGWSQGHHILICSVFLLGCLFAGQSPWLSIGRVFAQSRSISEVEGRTISEIQVRGNRRVGTSRILSKIRSKPGQSYDGQIINQDIKSVQKLRGIQAVFVSAEFLQEQLIVIFRVIEASVLASVEFEGNRRFSDGELRKLLVLGEGDFADEYSVGRGREALVEHYRKSGYDRAEVSWEISEGRLVYRIDEGPRIRIRKIRFEGNKQVSSGKLRSEISSKAHVFIFSSGNFDSRLLDADVGKLAAYLREKGYLDASVKTLPLSYSANQKWVEITFEIDEGALYKVSRVRFEGNEHISDAVLLEKLKVVSGEVPVHSQITSTNTKGIVDAYGRQGYVDARVRFTPVYLPDDPGIVELLYEITEGPQFRIGRIDIFGNQDTQDRVIRRQLLLAPNDVYDTSKLHRSRRRLMETRLFQDVQISDVPAGDFHRDVKISVREKPTAWLMMGVGVHSDAGVVGDFSFEQRNFDLFGFPSFKGAGQLLRLQAQPGSELTRFSVYFREPYIADLPISFGQSIYLRSRLREDYDENRLGVLWSLGHRFMDNWEIEGSVRLEEVSIKDIDADTAGEILAAEGTRKLTTVKATIIRDTRNSIFLPSKGDVFKISYEQTGALGGDLDFGRLETSYSRYITTHIDSLERPSILLFRAKFNTIFSGAPFYERYYAGGRSTIRGFAFRGVSPRVASVLSGTPVAIGSDWIASASGEYSFPLIGNNLRGAAFLDAAALEDGPGRASAGVSIRLITPVPLSADFAWPLVKDEDDDTRIFSFYIATTFW